MEKLSFALGGYKFKVDNGILTYQSIYGKRFTVRTKDIDTVTTDIAKKRGQSTLKIIGKGTVLAEVDLPQGWSEKAQIFILNNLDKEQ